MDSVLASSATVSTISLVGREYPSPT